MDSSQALLLAFENAVISDATGILLLVFLIVGLCVDKVFSRRRTRVLISAAATLLVILVVTGALHILSDVRAPSVAISTLGSIALALNPFVLHLLVSLFSDGAKSVDRLRKVAYALLVVNAGLCLSNPATGLVFTLRQDYRYGGGPLQVVPFVIVTLYIAIIIYVAAHSVPTIKRSETVMITAVTILLLLVEIGAMLPGFPQPLWNAIAALLVMYYLFFLIQDSHHDQLTGIFNRSVFASDIDRVNRDGNTALILLDVNDLKAINDSRGHPAGDAVIHDTGQLLLKTFSGFGAPYRIGGDEFVVICRSRHHADVKERLELFEEGQREFDWSISYGVGWCDPGVNPRTLIHDVDVTMYANKKMAHALHDGFVYEEGENFPSEGGGRLSARIDGADHR